MTPAGGASFRSGHFCPRESRRRASSLRLGTKRIREKGDATTKENKMPKYWTIGLVAVVVVLVVLAYVAGWFEYVAGWFEPAAPAAS